MSEIIDNRSAAGDIGDSLPPGAKAKLQQLRQLRADRGAMRSVIQDRWTELHREKTEAERRLRLLTDPLVAERMGVRTVGDNHPSVVEAKAQEEKLTEELRLVSETREVREHNARQIGTLVSNIEEFVTRSRGNLADGPDVVPRLQKGDSHADAVTRIRKDIDRTAATIAEVKVAPLPSALAKKKAFDQIEALAKRGAPSVLGIIEANDEIRWPQRRVNSTHRLWMAQTPPIGVDGIVATEQTDCLALLAWMYQKDLEDCISSEIDRLAMDEVALAPDEKQRRLAELEAESIELSRLEEALIEAAEAQGQMITRRTDAHPMAVLNVVLIDKHLPRDASP